MVDWRRDDKPHITDELAPLFSNFIPVEEREWYPWTWPEESWWKSAAKAEKEALLKRIRTLAREDFFFFCDEIMRTTNDPHLHTGVHAEICHLLQNTNEDLGVLIPRNHLKSTLCSINYPLWCLGIDNNMRILISSDTKAVARAFVRVIKENIKNNKRLHYVFPGLKPAVMDEKSSATKMWSTNEILVERPNLMLKEPSITVMSAGMDLAGTHYDLMLYDDIMTEKNAKNEEVIKTLIDWYEQTISLQDRNTRELLIGTRYRFNDIYGHLLKQGEPKFYVRKVIENDQYIWPETHSIARVKKMKRKLSPWVFSCQYYNNPVPPGDAEFDPTWIRRWDADSVRKLFLKEDIKNDIDLLKRWYATLNIYMGCDPARSEAKKSDYTVILVKGVDEQGREFALDITRKRLQTHKIVEEFIRMFKKWNPLNAKVETYGGDIHVYNNIKQAMKEQSLEYYKVGEYEKSPWVKGNDRIRVLQHPMSQGMLYIGSDPIWSEYETELIQFPVGDHDDILTIDAYMHSQQIRKKQPPIEEVDMGTGWQNRIYGTGKRKDTGTTWMSA